MNRHNICLLVARIIIGGIFIYSGWMKVSDMSQTIAFFATAGLPAILAHVVAYTELIGGGLLILGLFSEIAAAALAIIMVGAVYLTWSAGPQMFMTPLAILGGLLAFMAAGAGHYAVRLRR